MVVADDQGWCKVSKKKSSSSRRASRKKGYIHQSIGSSSRPLEATVLRDAVSKCKEEIVHSNAFRNMWRALQRNEELQDSPGHGIESSSFSVVVTLGIGNFSFSTASHPSASLWQLSCALALQRKINSDKSILFFDPCSTHFEMSFLEEMGAARVLSDSQEKTDDNCVFFLPHCPAELYDNVLFSNWGSRILFIIGNSLKTYCESLRFSSKDLPCMFAMLPWMSETRIDEDKSIETLRGNFEGAFNDTYVTLVESSDWPARPSTQAIAITKSSGI